MVSHLCAGVRERTGNFAGELFLTHMTAVRFDSGMYYKDMSLQMRSLWEPAATYITNVGFLTRVSKYMRLQSLIMPKGFAANTASILFLTRVSFQMFF